MVIIATMPLKKRLFCREPAQCFSEEKVKLKNLQKKTKNLQSVCLTMMDYNFEESQTNIINTTVETKNLNLIQS